MYGYIYKTTNKINNHYYIGKHKSNTYDPKYKGSGNLISRAIKKYGWDNFECVILEECFDRNSLNEREIYWISKFDSVNDKNSYNIAPGGEGLDPTTLSKEDQIKRASKISKNSTGLKHTFKNEQTFLKFKETRKNNLYRVGCKNSLETRNKISKTNKGRSRTEESLKKQSLHKRSKPKTFNIKRKSSKYKSKPVICVETNQSFPSTAEAARYVDRDSANLKHALSVGGICAGYHWKYDE